MEFVSGAFIERVFALLPLAAFESFRSSSSQWGRIARCECDNREIADVTVNPATGEVVAKKRNVITGRGRRLRADHPEDCDRFVKLRELTFTTGKLASGRCDARSILNLVSAEASVDASISRVSVKGTLQPELLAALNGSFKRVNIKNVAKLGRELDGFLQRIAASSRCTHLTIKNSELTPKSIDVIAELFEQKQMTMIDVVDCQNAEVPTAKTREIIEKWIDDPTNYKSKQILFSVADVHAYRTEIIDFYRDHLPCEDYHPESRLLCHPQLRAYKIVLQLGSNFCFVMFVHLD